MTRVIGSVFAALALASGCTSEPASTIESPADTLGQLAIVETTTTAAPTTTLPPATTVATSTTTSTTTTVASTNPPTTAAPATAAPTTAGGSGDSGGDLRPFFFSFEATALAPCAAGSTATDSVTLRWEAIGAESVYVAVGNVDVATVDGLPAAGSIALPRTCPGTTTYYVVASNPDGRTVQQVSR